ncbi:MAG: phage major capsid protein [Wolinella sp.]
MGKKIDFSKERMIFRAGLDTKSPIDEENKTISFIALSKDNLHKRLSLWGDEYYLSVDTSAVKFEAKTLYLDHEISFENAIGKIEEAKFEGGDFKVRVKFDDEVEASREAFARYKAGFSDSVSVGFSEYKLKEMDKIEGIAHYQIYEGVVNELSAVWQGADPNAKVATFSKEEARAKSAIVSEFTEIIKLAEITGKQKEALEAIKQNMSYAEFSQMLLEKNQSKNKIEEFNMGKKSETAQGFSLAKVILQAGNNNADLGFELEHHYNSQNGRFILPCDFGARFSDQITTTTTGAGAIATDFREDLLIESVKKESALLNECSWLMGLNARVEIPRNNSNISADFVEEGKSRESESLAFDKIILEPHTLLATIRITRTMMNMSAFSLEKIAYDAMKFALRRKLEESILYGKGVIKGIFETAGIPNIAGFMSKPTLENSLKFADTLDDNGGNIENAKFALKNSDVSKLRATPRSTTSDKMLIEEVGFLQGYPYFTTQLLKSEDVVFGDFKDIFIGSFGSVELLPHNERGGDVVLELFLDVDSKIAREKSFVIGKKD